MGFFESTFSYINNYSWSFFFLLCILFATRVISMGFFQVFVILLGVVTVLEVILSGTWVWGSPRTNGVLWFLFLNVLVLMFSNL
jgi:hypothetical protein